MKRKIYRQKWDYHLHHLNVNSRMVNRIVKQYYATFIVDLVYNESPLIASLTQSAE